MRGEIKEEREIILIEKIAAIFVSWVKDNPVWTIICFVVPTGIGIFSCFFSFWDVMKIVGFSVIVIFLLTIFIAAMID